MLYGALFLLSGCGLLIITNVLALGPNPLGQSAPIETHQAATALTAANAKIAALESDLASVRSDLAGRLLLGSGVALAIMAGVSIVLGRVVAGRVLRPLRAITATTRNITADSLHERLAVAGPDDEVKSLADTIDDLLERVEDAFKAQRLFVANAAHELRTPLATMRAALDVAAAKPEPLPPTALVLVDRIRVELDQIDRVLDDFLVLARTQHGQLQDRSPVSLDSLITAAVAECPLTVETSESGLVVSGSYNLITRLVANLIDNAIRHNTGDGWIRVTTSVANSTVLLVVENGGPRLDPNEVARLGQPFQRIGADRTSRGGTGLGLSIVSAIASAHGGHLDLRARPDGGLRAAVSLPQWQGAS